MVIFAAYFKTLKQTFIFQKTWKKKNNTALIFFMGLNFYDFCGVYVFLNLWNCIIMMILLIFGRNSKIIPQIKFARREFIKMFSIRKLVNKSFLIYTFKNWRFTIRSRGSADNHAMEFLVKISELDKPIFAY